MKSVLTLFMLAVFAMFISVDNAEAILSLEKETLLPPVEVEIFSLAPSAIAWEAEVETVSLVTKWPHGNYASPVALDVPSLIGLEISTAEGGSGRGGIQPGGGSRLR